MAANVVWVLDTSSLVQIRRSVANSQKAGVLARMTEMVIRGRLVFPKQVVEELERMADPQNPDDQYKWAEQHEEMASRHAPSLEEVKGVLGAVPSVLDPDKDTGAEEADPYILAMATCLRAKGLDARIVTEETRDMPRKMSLRTAGGLLGVPSVPLRAFLDFEGIACQSP